MCEIIITFPWLNTFEGTYKQGSFQIATHWTNMAAH